MMQPLNQCLESAVTVAPRFRWDRLGPYLAHVQDLQHTDTQQIKHAPTFQISASFGMGRTSDEISVFEADECTLSADPMQKHIQALPEQASAADCSAHNRNSEVCMPVSYSTA